MRAGRPNRIIQFVAADGKWRSVRLGKVSKKVAESVKLKMEALNAAAVAKLPLDGETTAWVAGIGDDLAAKLAAVGLIPERAKPITMAGLLDLYATEKESGIKPGTQTNHHAIANDLLGFYATASDPRDITPEAASGFLTHLRVRGLAADTVARRIRRVRSIFTFALKKKVIAADPFAEVKAASALLADRKAYVSVADTEGLMAAANPIWRVIIALCRYGGLRCSAEVLSLTWADVNFETNRMAITSPKTEPIPGKEYRVAPLFAALRPYLDEAFDLAEPGAVYVVGRAQGDRYRAAAQGPNGWVNANLRTPFAKLVRRSGLQGWPRPRPPRPPTSAPGRSTWHGSPQQQHCAEVITLTNIVFSDSRFGESDGRTPG